jgi:L-seryl-tRNA(Ser) seleniumtransferase
VTRRDLPSVDRLAASPALAHLPRPAAVAAARAALAEARTNLESAIPADRILPALVARAVALARPTLRPAINATGIVLHTNLGRASLARSAADAVATVGAGHTALEIDPVTGGRGDRQSACAALLRALTGADDALVVNNNAAATFLAIAALAPAKPVLLSRGQMIEIGGHFRLPDVIAQAGGVLVEVGTTNRTRIADYERALTDETGLILRCHPSNYRVVGFTEEASLVELVALARRSGVPFGDDLGSGALVDLAAFGLTDEPRVQDSVRAGADLCWFSGDKLLGGPQCGILLGRSARIQRLKGHPLARTLRPDKLTLAALEATLRLYQAGRAWDEIPTLRRIARPDHEIRAACERVAAQVPDTVVVPTLSEIGGGSLPGRTLPSFALAIDGDAVQIARTLRDDDTPVIGRIERGRLLLDLRAVDPDDEAPLVAAMRRAMPQPC